MDGVLIAAAAAGFGIAVLTTPAGVSGAVFLLPVQLGVLGVPSPQATPTNLLYNLLATPGGLIRWLRAGSLDVHLALLLIAAAAPGVVAGAVLRTTMLTGRLAVLMMVGVVLAGTGAWLLLGVRPGHGRTPGVAPMVVVAALAGVVGGAYGIGGGSLIAPALVTMGMPVARAAPAALATTLASSVVGIAGFTVLAVAGIGAPAPVAPAWSIGIAMGLGGLAGAHLGAGLHRRVPESRLRIALGVVALAVGAGNLVTGVLELW